MGGGIFGNWDLEKIRENGYEPVGKPALIENPPMDLREIYLYKALVNTNSHDFNCSAIVCYLKRSDDQDGHTVIIKGRKKEKEEDGKNYLVVLGLKKVEKMSKKKKK